MTSLDQAFIKAYRQRDAKPAAPAASVTGKVPLSDALKMGPKNASAAAPAAPTPERVLAALRRPSDRRTDPPAAPQPAVALPEQAREPVCQSKKPATAANGGGMEPGASAGTTTDPNAVVTAVATEEFRDLVRRLDEASGAKTSAPRRRVVPPPHLTVVRAGNEDETGPDVAAAETPSAAHNPPKGAGGVSADGRQEDPHGQPAEEENICDRLMATAARQFDQIGDAVLATSHSRQKILGIASCHRGEGATTVLQCVARGLVERGYRVAMTDAATETSLLAEYDVVLVDLGAMEGSIALGQFAAPGDPSASGLSNQIDAAVLVQDVRVTGPQDLSDAQRRLTEAGITVVGVVQNCVDKRD
jgi:Mrp family chromosome partitioning ATPase